MNCWLGNGRSGRKRAHDASSVHQLKYPVREELSPVHQDDPNFVFF